MKTLTLMLFLLSAKMVNAQDVIIITENAREKYGNTINIGVGIGYYGYVGYSMPVVHVDYEFDVARNFTLTPFVTAFGYNNSYYYGNPNNPPRYYDYRVTVIPFGLKGTYYFDQILDVNDNWDFYLAASLGMAFRKTVWESGYPGDTYVLHGSSSLYLDGHIGAEYHMNGDLGLFLDLSSGISTLGLAIHL